MSFWSCQLCEEQHSIAQARLKAVTAQPSWSAANKVARQTGEGVTYMAQAQWHYIIVEDASSISAPVHDVQLGEHTCASQTSVRLLKADAAAWLATVA